MMVLASCQEVAEQPAPGDVAAAGPDYPNLHTVPPRPQLSYTVEQRRAIVDGLIADRENARYRNDVARYRAGLSDVPPAAAPAFAAVPLEPQPNPADAVAPAQRGRDAPVEDPATEFLYEDDDFDSFMKEMDPADGSPDAGPEANAAPRGTKLIRASAVRPDPQAAAYPGRAPVVTLAMPPASASLPVPAPVETTLAGRAPAVVWGMPDMMPPPAEPDAMQPAITSRRPQYEPQAAPAETSLAGHAPGVVWGMPDLAPAPAGPMPAVPKKAAHGAGDRASPPAPIPIETVLAGRAPGVVWGMPDLAPAPAGPKLPAAPSTAAHSGSAARAAPTPAPARPRAAPAEMVLVAAASEPAQRTHEPRHVAPPAPAPVKPAPPRPATAVLAGPASVPVQVTAMAEGLGLSAETRAGPEPAAPPHPPPAKPPAMANATVLGPATMAPTGEPAPRPVPKPAADAAEIELAGGPVGVDPRGPRATALGSVGFDPHSALLSPHAIARLRQLLAEAAAREAHIQVVGEAAAPALALDRALAVGLALVQSGVSADRLQLTLARGGSSDQARLFLAAPEL